MTAIVGIDADGGVVLAGDERTTEGSVVTSDTAQRLFSYEDIGVVVAGDPGPVAEFDRLLDAKLRERRFDSEISLSQAARIAAGVASQTGTGALLAARDEGGVARLREIDSDGGVLETDRTAKGSGAELALGRLDSTGEVDLDEGESLARAALAAAADRDTETGPDVTVWRLADKVDSNGEAGTR